MIYNLNLESQQESIFSIINNKTLCLRNAPCFKFKVTWSGEHFPSSYSLKYSINFTWSSIRKPRSSSLSETTSTKHTMNNDMFISTMPEWFGMNPYLYVSLCKKLTPPPPILCSNPIPWDHDLKTNLRMLPYNCFYMCEIIFFRNITPRCSTNFLKSISLKYVHKPYLKYTKKTGRGGSIFFSEL